MKIVLRSLFVLFIGLAFVACDSAKDSNQLSTIESIKIKDRLVIGVKDNVPSFGYLNKETGKIEGFEIDIAKLLTKAILGDETKLVTIPVSDRTRGRMLDTKRVDAIIATFSATKLREYIYTFSSPYYQNQIGCLVKKDPSITSIEDLNNKIIGVYGGSTSKKAIDDLLLDLNMTFDIKTYQDYGWIKAELISGNIDAFCIDRAVLLEYVDEHTRILDYGFSLENYGIATRKDDPEFAEFIDEFVKTHKSDILNLINKWNIK
ncbi:amino acid ABC transporter, periplasmic aspartate/glutamate-binding protein [Campylobacter iguaniorum]|uniref:transporter substrate-binding domain-containing protein n=1 Tax=Campylobacter iguaniorum TaxID=1244531 RepID=UPI0007C8C67B|nr:transporter substrate-binding domain-containing protein [Campylobacter iguaniorum]ANE36175.1 amino acid ABC transporter, periplasmic aspartate/glutamate-binding protein [Campylobacter iguaniorum]